MSALKQNAQLMVPRHCIQATLDMAGVFHVKPESITKNRNQVIMQFSEIESGPMWLLDMRRSGIPFLWLWGNDYKSFRFVTALQATNHNSFRIGNDITSKRTLNPQHTYAMSLEQFRSYTFSTDILDKALVAMDSLESMQPAFAV